MKATSLKKLRIQFVSIVDEPAHPGARMQLAKSAENNSGTSGPELETVPTITSNAIEPRSNRMSIDLSKIEDEELRKQLEETLEAKDAEVAAATEAASEAEAKLEEAAAEVTEKSDLAKRLEATEKRAEQLEESARQRDFVEKAANYSNVAAAADLGPVLADVAKRAPEAYERLEAFLRDANERIALTDEIGKAAPSAEQDDISKAVAAVMESNPKLTEAAAMDQVLSDNPALYERTR